MNCLLPCKAHVTAKGKLALVVIISALLVILLIEGTLGGVRRERTQEKQYLEGIRLLENSQYTEALNVFNKLLSKRNSTKALLGKAEALYNLRRYSEAEAILLELIVDNTDAKVYRLLAEIYLNRGAVSQAMDCIDRGITIEGSLFSDLLQLIKAHTRILIGTDDLLVGREITVSLVFENGGTWKLNPNWTLENHNVNYTIESNGTIVITSTTEQDIVLTATLGSVCWSETLSIRHDWGRIVSDIVLRLNKQSTIPAFTNPNQLNNGTLIQHMFLYLDKDPVTFQELQRTAENVFGLNIKQLEPENVDGVNWDPVAEEFSSSPLHDFYDDQVITKVVNVVQADTQVIVEAIHLQLRGEFAEGEDEIVIVVYDEGLREIARYNTWAELVFEKVFALPQVASAPKRQYVFLRDETGYFYLAKCLK